MKITGNDVLFSVSLLFAIWFAGTGMVWTYWAAVFISYPFGLLSFVLWRIIKKENKKRTKYIPIILIVGLVLSLTVLVGLLLTN